MKNPTPSSTTRFVVPYSKPCRLSDPGKDFAPEELENLLQKSLEELNAGDLMCIFQSYLPAGEYNECAYYLPRAVEYVVEDLPDACSVLDNLLYWMHENAERLAQDHLFEPLQERFINIFRTDLQSFELDASPHPYPPHGDCVTTLLEVWNKLPRYDSLGDRLLAECLLPPSSYSQAAWIAYLLQNYFAGFSYAQESQIIAGWSQDPSLQQKVCDIVLENALDNDALCDYWAKCLARCGLL